MNITGPLYLDPSSLASEVAILDPSGTYADVEEVRASSTSPDWSAHLGDPQVTLESKVRLKKTPRAMASRHFVSLYGRGNDSQHE